MTVSAYRDHPIRAIVARILEMQSSPELNDPVVSESEAYSFARDKIFTITLIIQSLLDTTPAEFTSSTALNQISSHLQSAFNELSAFKSNNNLGHITNAVAQIEQNALQQLWGFAPQIQKLSAESLSTIFSALSSTSREAIKQISEDRDRLKSKLSQLESEITSQTERLERVSEGAAKERAESAATVAKLEQIFAQKETERAAAFESAVSEFRKNYTNFDTTIQKEATDLIASINSHKDNAARIVQVVGNIGVTGNYQQIADKEAKQANNWRWVTIAFFGLGITVAITTFIKYWGQPFSPESAWSIAIRLLYALAITSPAWYTAKESARHRTNSDRARQTELELASIGPFIELLPEERKIHIREQLTSYYFGKTVDAHNAHNPIDITAIKNIAIDIAKVLKT
jgi:hypothetical protein